MRHLALSIAIALLLGGCATDAPPISAIFSEVEPARADKALVYVYRPNVVPYSAYGLLVSVDGKEMVALPVDYYTRMHLDPGSRRMKFGWPLIAMGTALEGDFRFEAGRTYFIKHTVTTTREFREIKWTHRADGVPQGLAVRELKCCRLVRPKEE
jgi:hypothetical protein